MQHQPHPPVDPNATFAADSPMSEVVRAMRAPGSGLEVRERTWLGMKVPDAFLGSDAVDWLVERMSGGGADKREAKKYAQQMLKAGFLKHNVNKPTFSESCYYSFADEDSVTAAMAALTLSGNQRQQQEQQPMQQQHFQPPPPGAAGSMPPPTGPAPPLPRWEQQQQQPPPAFHHQQPPPRWVPGPPPPQQQDHHLQHQQQQQPLIGDQSIYNPSAPPPSANYSPYVYGGGDAGLNSTRTTGSG